MARQPEPDCAIPSTYLAMRGQTAFRIELLKKGIRLLFHFHYGLGVIASEAHRKICKAYGDEICDVHTAVCS
ncbi:hypothetical protein KIN20_008083 [Parelaphostrongylus tenuis]|uniref:Mos1 transposase HTH domain-containing protein n=1 Tax=Parelaphostrongylus tenuis TaxID=148309 RepID=A0AAD5QJK8_PARTN|nr:hypothetical protein KIN20_008083 [Parelaphostrongylus tenuis]